MNSPGPASWRAAFPDVARVIVSRRRIARRVRELSREIAALYDDRELTIVAVLTGALVFLSDLIRHLPLRMRLECVRIRSYPGPATQSQGAAFALPLQSDLRGRHVLVVDDILDSGGTLRSLLEAVRAQGPASMRTCVLLRKVRPDTPRLPRVDFVGFDIPDVFVVGYGLDHDDLYRNLPGVGVLKAHQVRRDGLGVVAGGVS